MEEFFKATKGLITLGASGQEYVPEMLEDANYAWQTLMCGNDPWKALARRLSERDLESLIRGLISYGRLSGRSTGGSVSPVIPLYYAFAERFPKSEPSLTEWIVSNRINDYEPFGSTICNRELSLDDHRRALHARVSVAMANEARDRVRQEEEGEAKRIQEAKNATTNLRNAVRRGDLAAVKILLEKGADVAAAVSQGESLLVIARENGRTAVAEFLMEKGIG